MRCMWTTIAGLLVPTGLICCLVGHRVSRLSFGLSSLLAIGTFTLLAMIPPFGSNAIQTAIVCSCLLAGVGAGVYTLERYRNLRLFGVGFVGGAWMAGHVLMRIFDLCSETNIVSCALGFGLATGLLGLFFERLVAGVATAVVGAWFCVYVTAMLVSAAVDVPGGYADGPSSASERILLGLWMALSLAGIYVQLTVLKPLAEQRGWPPGPAWAWINRTRTAIRR